MAWNWHWISQDWHWICSDWHRLDNWQTFVSVKNGPLIGMDWYGLAWNWHRICQDWHSFERVGSSADSMPTANDRRVCIKFILRVDWRPSRIEHLFLGYLDKRPQKWPEIGTGLADWHRIGGLAPDWQKIGRLSIPIILPLAIAIIGTWQLQL